MYGRNPYGGDEGPGFWVYRRDGRLVGQQGEMPIDLQVGAHERRSSWAMDLMVEPAWRLRGIGPALIAALLEHSSIVCVLYASREGYPAFVGSGCTDVGTDAGVPPAARPRPALRLPRRARHGAPDRARDDPVLRLADRAVAAMTRLAGARLVAVDRFDERVDEVWTTAAPTAIRWWPAATSRHDMAHRPATRPIGSGATTWCVGGGRSAYVVLRPTMSSGEPTAVVVDYLAPPRWVAPLLLAAGRAAQRKGAVALSVRTWNRRADRWLWTAGFLRRFQSGDYPIHLLVRCTDRADICAALHDPRVWFLTAADSDLESAVPDISEDL